jgi:hypothetical protein
MRRAITDAAEIKQLNETLLEGVRRSPPHQGAHRMARRLTGSLSTVALVLNLRRAQKATQQSRQAVADLSRGAHKAVLLHFIMKESLHITACAFSLSLKAACYIDSSDFYQLLD